MSPVVLFFAARFVTDVSRAFTVVPMPVAAVSARLVTVRSAPVALPSMMAPAVISDQRKKVRLSRAPARPRP